MAGWSRTIISRNSKSSTTQADLVTLVAAVILVTGWTACDIPSGGADRSIRSATVVHTGADVLVASGFEALDGMQVGLIVNHTSRSGENHLIDLMDAAPNVEVGALFGPEHGIRGDEDAGAVIDDGVDDATGAPVYSLYGSVRRPTPDMMQGLDALIFDIQDVGSRFYTFISTMGLSMQSAAEAGVPFVVLDRPNPLGGVRMEGFVRDSSLVSPVSQYPIPVRHGLTVGELAQMIRGEGWIPGIEELDLRVIQMSDWNRDMMWPETGLEWIPTSPNLPTFESALIYAGTCFIEATTASEGRGTPLPFLTIGAPWLDTEALVNDLDQWEPEGVSFKAGSITPISIPGASTNPKWKDAAIQTLQIKVIQPDSVHAVSLGLDLVARMYALAPDSAKADFFNERWMALLSGSTQTVDLLKGGMDQSAFEWTWRDDIERFAALRTSYLLYD